MINGCIHFDQSVCVKLEKELNQLKTALESIARLDPVKDSEWGVWDEWSEAECFNKAHAIANNILKEVYPFNEEWRVKEWK